MNFKSTPLRGLLQSAAIGLLITACATLAPTSEMQMYEAQSSEDANEPVSRRYPELVGNAVRHYNLAKEAQEDKEEELLAHHSKVSYLWWSAAASRSHADDMVAEHAEVAKELAAAEKQAKLAESAVKRSRDVLALQGQVADSEGTNSARVAINSALAALKDAERVDANVHAPDKFAEAESKLAAATKALGDGKTDQAATLAGEAETAAKSASASADPKYASTRASTEKVAAQQDLFKALNAISGVDAAIVEGGVQATIIGSFESQGVEIKPDMKATYDAIADVSKKHPDRSLVIEGHTDSKGSDSKNLQLSESRAKSVMSYLAGKGVEPGKVAAVGKGEQEPVAPNDTKAGRDQNRRIEILFATSG